MTPPVKVGIIAALFAFIGSYLGAGFATLVDPSAMRPVVIFLLVSVAIYTVLKPNMGASSKGNLEEVPWLFSKVSILTSLIGFYDGFFGPGTGTFFLFGFVVLFHLDFITASALSKIANISTNVAALIYFLPAGNIIWSVGITLAVGNLTGSYLGASLAVKKGTQFVRVFFLIVVTVLTVRLSYLWFW